jgi:diaminohydroxyphosphoribosylaminopyrimidine deaminase/5-amino-6-(5-phosphoribosylamino)uracil reductase
MYPYKNQMSNTIADTQFMQLALALAKTHLGQTAPNPCVGALVVRGNRIIGRGVTGRGGRPHAETQALTQAGAAARGATLHVTLEPCAHHGKTPPCAQAIIDAGIKRVVIATTDPDPRVMGQGIAMLRDAGIQVDCGVGKDAADAMHQGFYHRILMHRPLVALKLAVTRDGFMSVPGKKWLTSLAARQHTHFLRAHFDAIMVGSGTVLADDPMLNVRLMGMEHRSPLRVILDRRGRVPPLAKVRATAQDYPTLILGVEAGDMPSVLGQLAEKNGITRLFAEGGYALAKSLVTESWADRIYLYRSPLAAGPNGRLQVRDFGIRPGQDNFLDYVLMAEQKIGPDHLSIYERL